MAYINGKEILFSSNINSAQETEEKTVALDMASGSQTVTPSADKVLSKVVITKPSTMLPENIKEGINIGGVIGTHTAGSGGGGELPTLFAPTITADEGVISIVDVKNGDFAEKYSVYLNTAKLLDSTEKTIDISSQAKQNDEVYVIAKALLFNGSKPSNIAIVSFGELSYQKYGNRDEYFVNGIGTVTSVHIKVPATYNGLPVTSILMGLGGSKVLIETVETVDGLLEIGNSVFENNTNLKSIILAKTVTLIDNYAFSGCRNLETIDMTAFVGDLPFPTLGATNSLQNAGTNVSGGLKILVPSGRKATLSAMTNWSNYASNIVEV